MLLWWLVWCLSWLHSSHVAFLLEKPCFCLLDSSLIVPLDTSLFYWCFLGFSWYLSIDSSINRSFWLSILPWYLSIYRDFVLHTSRSIEMSNSIYTWGSTQFYSNSNISILLSYLSIQTSLFLQNLSSFQVFGLFQAQTC